MNFLMKIALLSFLFNYIWESLHSLLYSLHLEQKITIRTLLIASLGDVVIILLIAVCFKVWPFFQKRLWIIFPLGIVVAVGIEKYGLFSNRWSYNDLMPIIPYSKVVFAPTLQLAICGFLSIFITFKWEKKNNIR